MSQHALQSCSQSQWLRTANSFYLDLLQNDVVTDTFWCQKWSLNILILPPCHWKHKLVEHQWGQCVNIYQITDEHTTWLCTLYLWGPAPHMWNDLPTRFFTVESFVPASGGETTAVELNFRESEGALDRFSVMLDKSTQTSQEPANPHRHLLSKNSHQFQ
jgi:hypothetical protein